jgi:hypothetical protein
LVITDGLFELVESTTVLVETEVARFNRLLQSTEASRHATAKILAELDNLSLGSSVLIGTLANDHEPALWRSPGPRWTP